MSRLTSIVELPKGSTVLLAASIVLSTVGSAYAEFIGGRAGAWPKTWPKELEPLRKQAWTWLDGTFSATYESLTMYDIPFNKRQEFEAAWPHILKLKRKGAPLTLLRDPEYLCVEAPKAAGVRILAAGDIWSPHAKAPDGAPPPGTVTGIVLVLDGDIVDLNRIPLPADTPIIDRRFTERKNM